MTAGLAPPAVAGGPPEVGVLLLPEAGAPLPGGGSGHAGAARPGGGLLPPQGEVERARYRWWLGHQVACCVWRLLADELRSLLREPRPEPADRVALLYDAYSVLLLYAGSCSPSVYATVLRPAMYAAHPAFSGTWAADHEPVPGLLRVLAAPTRRGAVDGVLRAAADNRLTHIAVAKRLVPDGGSLLREAGGRRAEPPDPAERATFDAFFGVVRTSIVRGEFVAQLERRLAQVRADLDDHPLAPPSAPTRAAECVTSELCRASADTMALLARAVAAAADHHATAPAAGR